VGLGKGGGIAEAVAGVAETAGMDRIVELPAKVAATIGEMRQHALDRLPTRMRTEEVVVVGTVRREQVGQRIAVTSCRDGAEASYKIGEIHAQLPPRGRCSAERAAGYSAAPMPPSTASSAPVT